MAYKVDLRDIYFNLFEMLHIDRLSEFEAFKDLTEQDCRMILSEAEKFAVNVLAPTLPITDKDGAKFVNGKVVVPEAVREAFHRLNEGGWGALGASPEYGGQGLPGCLAVAVMDIFCAANTGFGLYQGLTSATAHLLEEEGSDYLRKTFCRKMYTGQWAGAMVLTEPQAGSAVGDIKTTARRDGDSYLLTGNKIFISGGDHDMTENIIHVLLARTEGAPPGIKGLSLFAAPKYLVNEDGSLGAFNNIRATGVEEKMGLHSSATCALSYGDDGPCRAWIVGGLNEGIQIMFKLMNHARLGAGLQGTSQASAAYQIAVDYARERIQGVRAQDFRDVNAPRVPILDHPDIRRMLLTQKAIVEATRSLIYTCSFWLDQARHTQDEGTRSSLNQLVDLLTPVCKAYSTEKGFDATCLALQVLGGYGYCEEYGVSVLVRDAKIGTIYEGTTGIQAMDLLGRKVSMKSGALFFSLMNVLNEFVEKNGGHPELGREIGLLREAKDQLAQTTMVLGTRGMSGDLEYPLLYATPYMFLLGHVVCSYFLINQALVASQKLAELCAAKGARDEKSRMKLADEHPDARFYFNKIRTARFFAANILPEVYGVAKAVEAGDVSPLEFRF